MCVLGLVSPCFVRTSVVEIVACGPTARREAAAGRGILRHVDCYRKTPKEGRASRSGMLLRREEILATTELPYFDAAWRPWPFWLKRPHFLSLSLT